MEARYSKRGGNSVLSIVAPFILRSINGTKFSRSAFGEITSLGNLKNQKRFFIENT